MAAIKKIEAKSIPFSAKVAVEREDFEHLSKLAKKYITIEKKESKLQKALGKGAAAAEILQIKALTNNSRYSKIIKYIWAALQLKI